MKALEILKRNDYVRATNRVVEAVSEIAVEIRKKMDELDLSELYVKESDITIGICKLKSNSGHSYTFLGIEDGRSWGSLMDSGSYYYMNDFTCWVERATNEKYVLFANNIMKVLSLLDEIESEQTEKAACSEFFEFYEGWKAYQQTMKDAADFENNNQMV